MIKLFYN